MEAPLTTKEIDTLIEAMEAWETKDVSSHITSRLMGAFFSDKLTEEGKKKLEEKERADDEKRKLEEKSRKETSTLLKAKLIGMKHDKNIALTIQQSAQPL